LLSIVLEILSITFCSNTTVIAIVALMIIALLSVIFIKQFKKARPKLIICILVFFIFLGLTSLTYARAENRQIYSENSLIEADIDMLTDCDENGVLQPSDDTFGIQICLSTIIVDGREIEGKAVAIFSDGEIFEGFKIGDRIKFRGSVAPQNLVVEDAYSVQNYRNKQYHYIYCDVDYDDENFCFYKVSSGMKLIDRIKIKVKSTLYSYTRSDTAGFLYAMTFGDKNGLDTQIKNTLKDNESLKDSLRDDVYWRAFEQAHDSSARLKNILDGVSGLISDDMLFDSDGNLTDYGVAKTANLVGQYENARKEVQNYSNDIENLNKLYGEGKYTEEEYEEKLNELQSSMLDSAASMKNYSDSIIDMYKNMAQAELDELFKLIDARNDALNAKKAYYDYDKTIKSKTKDLQALRAQRAALEGVDTLEATARRALLTARIEEADADLNDTIMEHQFELSRDALNDLKETLQGAFDEEWENVHLDLDRIAELMSSANGLIESSADTVSSTLRTLLEHYGIDPSAPNHTAAGNTPDTGKAGQSGTGGTESGASPAQGSPKPDQSKPTPIQSEPEQIQIRPEPIQIRPEQIQNRPAPIQSRPASIQGRNNTEPPSELMIRLDEMSVHMHPPVPPVLNTAIALPSGRENAGNTITQNYDSLIHIDGSVDTTTLEEMKRLSKDLLKQSCEFTSQSIYRGYIHSGGTRRV